MKNEDIYSKGLAEKQRYDRHILMTITGENRSEKTIAEALPRIAYMENRREMFSAISSLPIRSC